MIRLFVFAASILFGAIALFAVVSMIPALIVNRWLGLAHVVVIAARGYYSRWFGRQARSA